MPIPRLIHQTWKTSALPADTAPFARRVRAACHASGFEWRFHDDEQVFGLIALEFPELEARFRSLPVIERMDLWRYLAVYTYGGFYLDLDTEPTSAFRYLPRVLDRPVVQLEREGLAMWTRSFCRLPEIGQFFFGFPQKSPLLRRVIDLVLARLDARPYRHLGRFQEVLHTTGPGAFGDALWPFRDELHILPAGEAVLHHCMGSWVEGAERGRKRLVLRRGSVRTKRLRPSGGAALVTGSSPESASADLAPLTIVTAASERFSRALWQFLRSAERAGFHERYRFIAFDLGLDEASRARVHSRFSWCEVRDFDFSKWPPHVALEHGNYAWKPIIIATVLEEATDLVLWLDSGTLFKRPLDEVIATLRRDGTYTLAGQAPVTQRAESATIEALEAPLEVLDLPERVAGVVGLDPSRPAVRQLVREWRRHALIEDHIRPEARTIQRHMNDQALLTILLHKMAAAGELVLNEGEVDINSSGPIRWISTRNKVPTWVPTWADPLARAYRAVEKTIDQRLHGVKRWSARRIGGGYRWAKEHYSVMVRRGTDGRVARIRAEPFSYYADPFIWQRAGATWLFVEQVRYFENRGRLVAVPLDTELRPGRPRPVLPLRCHASFPYLFEHDGQLYMVPETSAHRYVDLFVCERFPDRWRRARRLIHGVDAADSVVFHQQGLWWLSTSLRDPGANLKRQLALFFTDDLMRGSWQPHPMNAHRLYADRPHGGGRNAGPIFRPPGQDLLLRVMQENRRHYGDGVSLMQIEVLTKDDYRESPYAGEHEFSELAARDNPHHVSSHGDLIAWDVRDRTSYAQHLPEFAGGVRPDPRARRAGKRPPSRKRRSDGTDPYS